MPDRETVPAKDRLPPRLGFCPKCHVPDPILSHETTDKWRCNHCNRVYRVDQETNEEPDPEPETPETEETDEE